MIRRRGKVQGDGGTYPDLGVTDGNSDARLSAPEVAGATDGVLVGAAGIHQVTLVGLVMDEPAPAVHAGIAVGAVVAVLLRGGRERDRGREGRHSKRKLHDGEEMRKW